MRLPRASGVLLHPSSLPGPHGSGDLGSAAYEFVDWLANARQSLWQVLPLGRLGPGHSPYMSPSAFAGNPLLIDLAELQQRGWLDGDALAAPPAADPRRIDFATMTPWRMQRLAQAAAAFADRASATERAEFDDFCAQQHDWLDDDALFMALTEAHHGAAWPDWDPALARRDPQALAAAARRHKSRLDFWRFCQWSFHRQWSTLKAHANRRGVRIIGDVPIFVAHGSADVWAHQRLFELDADGRPSVVAGVPPDYFSATGQRWGNPLYRWTEHARQGHAWWIARLRHALAQADIVRIDHFRGFAAHWEIPASQTTAVHGRWVPGPGAALFDALGAALGALPIIAEDLGHMTPDVEALRRQLKLPGMRVLQFAFQGDASNPYLPHNFDHDTVVYTGTHDNDTTVGWWAGAGDAERHYARAYLGTDGHDIAWALIRAAFSSVADTAIAPLQDVLVLPGDCRMNLPGQGAGWWSWRFEWRQFQPWHSQRLADKSHLFGRDRQVPAP